MVNKLKNKLLILIVIFVNTIALGLSNGIKTLEIKLDRIKQLNTLSVGNDYIFYFLINGDRFSSNEIAIVELHDYEKLVIKSVAGEVAEKYNDYGRDSTIYFYEDLNESFETIHEVSITESYGKYAGNTAIFEFKYSVNYIEKELNYSVKNEDSYSVSDRSFYFSGKICGFPITGNITIKEGEVFGYYMYDRHPAALYLKGNIVGDQLKLSEYPLGDDIVSGEFEGEIINQKIIGKWKSELHNRNGDFQFSIFNNVPNLLVDVSKKYIPDAFLNIGFDNSKEALDKIDTPLMDYSSIGYAEQGDGVKYKTHYILLINPINDGSFAYKVGFMSTYKIEILEGVARWIDDGIAETVNSIHRIRFEYNEIGKNKEINVILLKKDYNLLRVSGLYSEEE